MPIRSRHVIKYTTGQDDTSKFLIIGYVFLDIVEKANDMASIDTVELS